MALQLPIMLESYLEFCKHREQSKSAKKVNLQKCGWIYPTTLLPLINFIKENKLDYIPPENESIAKYIETIVKSTILRNSGSILGFGSYVPIINLPKDREKANEFIELIYKLQEDNEYGGKNAFNYFVSELVNNIYEHSRFTNAFIVAQKYPKMKFTEICIFDNGITIPGNFQQYKMIFQDFEAIGHAINGLSTKSKERGFGLGSSIRIFTEGLKGEILIVSRNGAIYIRPKEQKLFKLEDIHKLSGTLISVRIPYPSPKVDIYDYIQ